MVRVSVLIHRIRCHVIQQCLELNPIRSQSMPLFQQSVVVSFNVHVSTISFSWLLSSFAIFANLHRFDHLIHNQSSSSLCLIFSLHFQPLVIATLSCSVFIPIPAKFMFSSMSNVLHRVRIQMNDVNWLYRVSTMSCGDWCVIELFGVVSTD